VLAGRERAVAEPTHLEHAKAATFRMRALDGERLDLDALRAHGPVVLDFWATWCEPCVQALPELEQVRRRWQERGVTVIGISIDGPRNQARVRPFAARLGLEYPILFDADGSLQRAYQITAVPTTVVVDTAGNVAYASEGWWPGETKKIEKMLATLLPDSVSARP